MGKHFTLSLSPGNPGNFFFWIQFCEQTHQRHKASTSIIQQLTPEHYLQRPAFIISCLATHFHSAALQFIKIIISTFKTINICVPLWGESWRLLIIITSILLLPFKEGREVGVWSLDAGRSDARATKMLFSYVERERVRPGAKRCSWSSRAR